MSPPQNTVERGKVTTMLVTLEGRVHWLSGFYSHSGFFRHRSLCRQKTVCTGEREERVPGRLCRAGSIWSQDGPLTSASLSQEPSLCRTLVCWYHRKPQGWSGQGRWPSLKSLVAAVPARTLPSLLPTLSHPYQLTKYGPGQLAKLGSPGQGLPYLGKSLWRSGHLCLAVPRQS